MHKALLALLLPLWVGASGLAWGQEAGGPRYVDSQPERGAFLHRAPPSVSVTFSEPLGPGSTITVSNECGERADDGAVAIADNEMRVGLTSATAGDYAVSYVAGGRGDKSGSVPGAFGFTAHLGPSCDSETGGSGHGSHGGGAGGGGGGGGGHQDGHGSPGAGGDHLQPSDHAPSGHSDTTHTPGDAVDGSGGGGKHGGHRSDRKPAPSEPTEPTEPTARRGGGSITDDAAAAPGVAPRASGGDLVVALGLAAAFGVLGGWILRATPDR